MNERIGKVELDTRYYSGDNQYSDGDETENKLMDLVSGYSEEQYPEVIARDGSWPVLYHLSPIRENILNWYPFEEGKKALELGAGCGAVTGALLKKGVRVTAVDLSLRRSRINATRHADAEGLRILIGAAETVLDSINEQFDYVTLIGVLEYAGMFSGAEKPYHDLLNRIRCVMKEDGSLWVAIENQLGLKYFAGCREDHTGRLFEGIEGYPHKDGPRTFSRKELITLAAECGFSCRFYYPYPDYKLPISIYSDDRLPREGELIRNWQAFGGERLQLFNETRAYETIIKAGLFPNLSNSFLVEMRKKVNA